MHELGSSWHTYAGEMSALGAFDEAAKAYGQALRATPAETKSMINLAIVHFNLAAQANARADSQAEVPMLAAKAEDGLRQAIGIDEQQGNPHYYLGIIQEATGRQHEAIASWKKALSVNPAAHAALAKLQGGQ